ncbi:hypothetical protein MFRU_004g00670 [Monilinia fructicola]|uniref:Glutamyl-tRNA amidotransferase complex subunit Gta3 domain-containing protein n=1 Tax=Monilinia fructicola TaxID=38448 RepID=A0A5M9JI94_MONFR|nr:hypothetical protein EYC84_000885 [Monilinia fructicola]KAG4033560.1 hypothetical protein MFRU_004g00670 [Monilinia fructicola]
MSGSICLRCRASLRYSIASKRSARASITRSRPYSTAEANQGTPTAASVVDEIPLSSSKSNERPYVSRSVKLYGTRIATPLTPKSEDQELPIRRVPARKHLVSDHQEIDIDDLLSKPTWSVRSLLPSPNEKPAEEVTVKQLHHLCRLSALPLPKTPEEEKKLLDTLHLQLHFLRDIQKADTEGIEPLRSIRDETLEAEAHESIGLDTEEIKAALQKEEFEGRNKRPRRRADGVVDTKGAENWDVTATATENVEFGGGKYFIVRSGKGTEQKAVQNNQLRVEGEAVSDIETQKLEVQGEN